jgi:hypothetical protein
MYRQTQLIPGGSLTLLGVLALSFVAPAFAAGALGLNSAHGRLIGWIVSHQGLPCLILWLLYGMSGFCMLLATAVAVYGTGVALMRGLAEVKGWALKASLEIAKLLGEALYWPIQIFAETLWEEHEKFAAYVSEQHEMRRIYREEYANDFSSYRAFARYWRALKDGSASEPDPLERAIWLMGLPEAFTRDELKRRFHTLIAPIHPDKVGPNGLATQLIDAYQLINQRKGWK